MMLGENIQKLRKKHGLSQDELAQKLFISKQTVKLWENDQAAPTLDNLLSLKEIFNVSADEILGLGKERPDGMQPDEVYNFSFKRDELNDIFCLQRKTSFTKVIVCDLVLALLSIWMWIFSSSELTGVFFFGALFACVISHIKAVRAFNKLWKTSIEKVCSQSYEYLVFRDHIWIYIHRENETVFKAKCSFASIEQIQQLDNWLLFRYGGQLYIVRKSDLKENSAFNFYLYKNSSKVLVTKVPDKCKTISILLFVASLLSILAALALAEVMSAANGLFSENMWVFFLFTPIPIVSTVFGFILRSRGYKYKKNIIAGIIMTLLLCIYGSFVFIF